MLLIYFVAIDWGLFCCIEVEISRIDTKLCHKILFKKNGNIIHRGNFFFERIHSWIFMKKENIFENKKIKIKYA